MRRSDRIPTYHKRNVARIFESHDGWEAFEDFTNEILWQRFSWKSVDPRVVEIWYQRHLNLVYYLLVPCKDDLELFEFGHHVLHVLLVSDVLILNELATDNNEPRDFLADLQLNEQVLKLL